MRTVRKCDFDFLTEWFYPVFRKPFLPVNFSTFIDRWTGQHPILAYTTWRDLNQSQLHISIRGITKPNRARSAGPTKQWPLKHLAPLSVSAQEFLVQIGRRLTDETMDPRETTFLFQRLSVAVQRFNAACLADPFTVSESAPWPFQTRSFFIRYFSPRQLNTLGFRKSTDVFEVNIFKATGVRGQGQGFLWQFHND